MTISAALDSGRAAAEARMLDECEIRYRTGNRTQDPTTGETTDEYAVRFTTKCRVSVGRGLAVRGEDVGGRTAAVITLELHIPINSPAVEPTDVAVMTSIHATSDPMLAGATLTLAGAAPGSQTTARRLQVSEVLS